MPSHSIAFSKPHRATLLPPTCRHDRECLLDVGFLGPLLSRCHSFWVLEMGVYRNRTFFRCVSDHAPRSLSKAVPNTPFSQNRTSQIIFLLQRFNGARVGGRGHESLARVALPGTTASRWRRHTTGLMVVASVPGGEHCRRPTCDNICSRSRWNVEQQNGGSEVGLQPQSGPASTVSVGCKLAEFGVRGMQLS